MTPRVPRHPEGSRRRVARAWLAGAALVGLAWSADGLAQNTGAASAPPRPAVKPAPEQGVKWRDLKPSQQAVLKPLEREWPTIAATHKQKWVELSSNFSKRSPADQARIQARMTDWAGLTAQERGQARLHFQEAKQVDPTERKARWDAYQALSPEQKKEFAARAAPASRPAARNDAPGRDAQAKSNIVPNPTFAAPPKVVAPSVVQARPGATTTLITKRPAPPSHQQTGLPKIAATPEFVDKATLLPQRGPQGAATRSAAAPASGRSAAQ